MAIAVDTTTEAANTPDKAQPWKELGLKQDEYDRIKEILGRRPTSAELAMYSVMWSEHCSYKSSKIYLRQFGEKVTPEMKKNLMVGMGENAGVVDIGEGWAVTFKVESHNHPSYIEPFQGAATGVGGIVRDILTMGARPIAVMDQLRFGAVDHPDTARVVNGVVSGISFYGNCLGLPNIGGETVFDKVYQGNPLVNALSVGALRHEDLKLAKASNPGDLVILFGARTGADGIGGVSVLASETFDSEGPSRRPAVQVGDPFAEKVLIECSLELYAAQVVAGIQDLGGAGLSCATSELASNGNAGMRVQLKNVLLRDESLTPEEILMSESQERMMAIVPQKDLQAFTDIVTKHEVEFSVMGEVISEPRLYILWGDEEIVNVPPRTVAHDGPVYERPVAYPSWIDALNANSAATLPRATSAEELKKQISAIVSSPNQASKSWITDQYDHYVGGNTALAMPDDSGMVRVSEETGLGVAIATDANGKYCQLDPYQGTQLALAESYRNVAASGASPMAVTNCLNFGSPEDPEVMWQFSETVRGLADACLELGLPVTGGNVSFYNQTGTLAILPTPVIGVLGVVQDVTKRTPMGIKPNQVIYVIGNVDDNFSGSEWAYIHGKQIGDHSPVANLDMEERLVKLLLEGQPIFEAAHDISNGGFAASISEMVMRTNVGATIKLEGNVAAELLAETPGRVIVAINEASTNEIVALAGKYQIPVRCVGATGGNHLTINGAAISIDELRDANTGVFEALFG